MSVPEFPVELEPIQAVQDSFEQVPQPIDDSQSRRDFFRLGAGVLAHFTPEITASGAAATAATVVEVKLNQQSAELIVKMAHGVSNAASAASYGRETTPVLSHEMSRRTIAPLLGVVALTKAPIAMRGLKALTRNLLWNK